MKKLALGALACAAAMAPIVAAAAGSPPYLGIRGTDCSGKPATIVSDPAAGEEVVGTEGHDVIVARGARKVVRALGGHDTVCVETSAGGAGALVDAGDGDDLVWVGGEAADEVRGGLGDDRIHGNHGDDRLFGDDGRDAIFSGSGDDLSHGGAGDDQIHGGTQDDVLAGDAGVDLCDGDHGDDAAWDCEQYEQLP